MSEMRVRDLRLWAKEELADFVKRGTRDLIKGNVDMTFDEEAELKKQSTRILKFLFGQKLP